MYKKFLTEGFTHWRNYSREILSVLSVLLFAASVGYIVGRIALGGVESRVEGYIEEVLGVELSVRRTFVTPWLQVVIEGVRVVQAAPTEPLPIAEVARVVLYPRFGDMVRRKIGFRGVFLEQPRLYIRFDEKGVSDLKPWLDAVTGCRSEGFNDFPDRMKISGGIVVVEPPEWGAKEDLVEVHEINGIVGKGRGTQMVVNLSGQGEPGVFKAGGYFAPCRGGNLMLKFNSDKFDFNRMVNIFGRFTREAGKGWDKFAIGEGSMEAELAGSLAAPVLQGKISSEKLEASFLFSDNVLNFTDIRVGKGRENIAGGGTIEFTSANLPMKFSFFLDRWKVSRLFRRMLGFQYAPQGSLTGYLKMRGSLNDLASLQQSGSLEVGEGKIYFPSLVLGESGQEYDRRQMLPFAKFSSNVIADDKEVQLIGMHLEGENFELNGRGKLNGDFDLMQGWKQNAQFETSVEFSVHQLSALLASVLSLRDLMEGKADGELRLMGRVSSLGSLHGMGHVSVGKGWIRNPYGWAGGESQHQLDFDGITAGFAIKDGAIKLSRLVLSGNGIFIEIEGEIAFNGALTLSGHAEMAGDIARNFTGVAYSVPSADLVSSVILDVPFTIGGSLRDPLMQWGHAKEM